MGKYIMVVLLLRFMAFFLVNPLHSFHPFRTDWNEKYPAPVKKKDYRKCNPEHHFAYPPFFPLYPLTDGREKFPYYFGFFARSGRSSFLRSVSALPRKLCPFHPFSPTSIAVFASMPMPHILSYFDASTNVIPAYFGSNRTRLNSLSYFAFCFNAAYIALRLGPFHSSSLNPFTCLPNLFTASHLLFDCA